MECLYHPSLNTETKSVIITDSEFKHIKALRLKLDESILITSGQGLIADSVLSEIRKDYAILEIQKTHSNHNENSFHSALAIGILSNTDKMEYAIEKSIELGVNDIYPLITKRTQKSKLHLNRLRSKAISAMKQCKRSVLTNIHEPIKLSEFLANTTKSAHILCDENGDVDVNLNEMNSIIVYIGPEGGFSELEVELINSMPNAHSLDLGIRRLRAETASIVALSLVNFKMRMM